MKDTERIWFPPYLLAKIRKYGISNSELAVVIGVDRSTVSKKLNLRRQTTALEVALIVRHLQKRGIKISSKLVLSRIDGE